MSAGPNFNWDAVNKPPEPTGPPQASTVPKQLAAGWHEELSSAAHAAKNVSGVVDSAVRKVQEWTGKSPTWSKNYITKTMEEIEQHQSEQAKRLGAPHGAMQSLARSVGAAPVQIGEYGAAMVIARRPAAAFALVDAAKEMDKGAEAAVKAGIAGGISGYGTTYMSEAGIGKRVAANVGLGAGRAAVEGQGPGGIVTGALAQGAFGLPGKIGKPEKPATLYDRVDMVTKAPLPYLDWFKKTFAAGTVDEPAKRTAGNVRENLAIANLERTRAEHVGKAATDFFDKQPKDLNLRFRYGYESGNVPPGLEHFAGTIKSLTDNMYDELHKRGMLNSYKDNYMPGMYKDPVTAAKALAGMDLAKAYTSYLSRTPAGGKKGFAKPRKYPTAEIANAVAGLELVHDNPMDSIFAGLSEGRKAIAWHDIMTEDIAKGRGMWKQVGKKLPEGREHWMKPGNDKTFEKYGRPVKGQQPGRKVIADYYTEPSIANLIGNHLAPGWQGNPFYRGLRGYANALNMLQLGLSFRHAVTTSLYSLAANTQSSIQNMLRGNLAQAAKGFAESATIIGPPIRDAIQGRKMLKEALQPGSIGGETAELLRHHLEGGGRLEKDQFYRTQMKKQFNQMWAEGKVGRALVFKAPMIPVEYLSNIVMDEIVPTLKRGTAAHLLGMEIQRLGPNATKEQWREAAGKIVDNIDNVMGEMVYDNRFISRAWKDLGQIGLRSLGWTGGSLSLFAGAGKDIASHPATALRDSQKAAFVAGLAVTMGYVGAITQMLFGQGWPKQLSDYSHPRTGGTDVNGNPERVHFPDYLTGDLTSFAHDPVSTVVNKLNPVISIMGEMLRNRDFYGQSIWDDPQTALKYAGRQVLPFSISQPLTRAEQEGEYNAKDFLLPQIGLNKAPLWISESPAERLASEYAVKNMGGVTRKASRADESRMVRQFSNRLKKGEDISGDLGKAVEAGELGKTDIRDIAKGSARIHLQQQINRMSLEQSLDVYEIANPKEKEAIRGMIYRKVKAEKPKSAQERERVMDKFRKVFEPEQQQTAPPPTAPIPFNWEAR